MEHCNGKRLGDMLVEDGRVSTLQVAAALQEQRARKLRLGSALMQLGFLHEADLAVYLSMLTDLPFVNPREIEVPDEVIDVVPEELAVEHGIYPLQVQDGTLQVAVADPLDAETFDRLTEATGLEVIQLVAPDVHLKNAIRRRYAICR
jgi:type IV pilus assembly protein PilB